MRNEPIVSDPERQTRRRLSPAEVEALIRCRVCELRVIAARTAVEYGRKQADAAWEAFRSSDIDD